MPLAAELAALLTPDGFEHMDSSGIEYTMRELIPLLKPAHDQYTWRLGTLEAFVFRFSDLKDERKHPEFAEIAYEVVDNLVGDFRKVVPDVTEERLQTMIDELQLEKLSQHAHLLAGAASSIALWGLARPAKMLELACKRLRGADQEENEAGAHRWPQHAREATEAERKELKQLFKVINERAILIIGWFDAHGASYAPTA